ncbi:hypothetical protein TNCV_3145751 [Trichonephila clavipes]|nr:hypothetical protein TNCV_3145751 [Trichonephila clavipes]
MRSYHWIEKGSLGNRRIARHMGRSDVAVRRCCQEWVDSSRFQHQDGSGRPRATADNEDRLIHDNAKPHMVLVAMNCLTACQTILRPTRSPDFSPIEHVWDMMGRLLYLPENADNVA